MINTAEHLLDEKIRKERRKQANIIRQIQRKEREQRLKRWYIMGSWKPGIPSGDPSNWKSWRKFFVVPILFKSENEAWEYGRRHMFKNMPNRKKLTYSVQTRWLKE